MVVPRGLRPAAPASTARENSSASFPDEIGGMFDDVESFPGKTGRQE